MIHNINRGCMKKSIIVLNIMGWVCALSSILILLYLMFIYGPANPDNKKGFALFMILFFSLLIAQKIPFSIANKLSNKITLSTNKNITMVDLKDRYRLWKKTNSNNTQQFFINEIENYILKDNKDLSYYDQIYSISSFKAIFADKANDLFMIFDFEDGFIKKELLIYEYKITDLDHIELGVKPDNIADKVFTTRGSIGKLSIAGSLIGGAAGLFSGALIGGIMEEIFPKEYPFRIMAWFIFKNKEGNGYYSHYSATWAYEEKYAEGFRKSVEYIINEINVVVSFLQNNFEEIPVNYPAYKAGHQKTKGGELHPPYPRTAFIPVHRTGFSAGIL